MDTSFSKQLLPIFLQFRMTTIVTKPEKPGERIYYVTPALFLNHLSHQSG
ncbi:MAG TPA: hypothetical protein VL485_08240 [Ktedonobacteraceae bacterium]|jgi:hypothetical protein|nr:hypothetical protein [Ktedonobacteraceae bacterium]